MEWYWRPALGSTRPWTRPASLMLRSTSWSSLRAPELVSTLELRQQEQAAMVAAGDQAAAARLIEALAAGTELPPVPPLDISAAEALAVELRTVKAALAELEKETATAEDRLARCRAGVRPNIGGSTAHRPLCRRKSRGRSIRQTRSSPVGASSSPTGGRDMPRCATPRTTSRPAKEGVGGNYLFPPPARTPRIASARTRTKPGLSCFCRFYTPRNAASSADSPVPYRFRRTGRSSYALVNFIHARLNLWDDTGQHTRSRCWSSGRGWRERHGLHAGSCSIASMTGGGVHHCWLIKTGRATTGIGR
jgi:hypothetical protein